MTLLTRNPQFSDAYAAEADKARAEIIRRHAAELNALIRKADAAFVEKVGEARNERARLLRALPWDFQRERRDHEFIVFCEELFGTDLGEMIAWDIMQRGGVR
jgi:predicted RNA methylase